jgi:hypothetical protein
VNVNQLTLRDVAVNWDTKNIEPKWHNAFTFKNIENLNLDKLAGTQAPNNSGVFIELNSVKNAIIENCMPSPATNTFVKVNDAFSSAILLNGNYILSKTKKMEFAKGVKRKIAK